MVVATEAVKVVTSWDAVVTMRPTAVVGGVATVTDAPEAERT